MLTRRLLWLIPALLLLAAGYSSWLAWQVKGDLVQAEAAAEEYRSSLESGSSDDRETALADLRAASSSAAGRTSSPWWSAMTYVPVVGDDADGIRALTSSLDLVARDGVTPLGETLDLLPKLTAGSGVDLEVLEQVSPKVAEARVAFDKASDKVNGVDSSGFAGSVRSRFDDYAQIVNDADRMLTSAETATDVLPGMLGGDGARDYLMIFQNNAEIRATGGLPGSWALVHTENGELTMGQQGSGAQFGRRSPALPMSRDERAVYDGVMGAYFLSSNFTPDFPRAAELWTARWEEAVSGPDLDGVISLDPVAMSYLLGGAGPVQVGERTITAENAVEELLNRPYLELEPEAQDVFFARAARAVFEAVTGDLADPTEFVKGISRAADEGRLLVAPFDDAERRDLDGTRVLGELTGDDGSTPHVDIGLNDATASKMSYYLRYGAEVRAAGCDGDTQELRGSMSLSQSIPPSAAATLPVSVTGGGVYGNDPGDQLVFVRIYGPHAGTIEGIRMDGRALDPKIIELDGRPVATLIVQLSTTADVVINWSMQTGEGQTGGGKLGMTPSIVPGNNDAEFATAC